MANSEQTIRVVSHVARDLLQNAALFKTDKLVVWEYVSNGLQYTDLGKSSVVSVLLDSKKKRITVSDNGRGMNWEGLQNFFVMHGENIDRREGHPGRGRFGTGKSAAFGIADVLRVTSVQNEKRSIVELRREDIDVMGGGDPVPVNTIAKEEDYDGENGTRIDIEKIHLRSLDQAGIIRFVERHLARWPRDSVVYVNNHECEVSEPPVAAEYEFMTKEDEATKIGEVKLIVKVSMSPLDEDARGVSVFSKGVWHETTLGGEEGREMSQYIFGEIDVPILDQDESPIPPFDLSRSMQLNPENESVRVIHAFIGRNVRKVRLNLVEEEKKQRATEEAKRLQDQANEISRVINEDFEAFRKRIAKAKAKAVGVTDIYEDTRTGAEEEDDFIIGGEIPVEITDDEGSPGSNGGSGGGEVPRQRPVVAQKDDGDMKGRPAGGGEGSSSTPMGGFRIRFENQGESQNRALYVSDERTIYINLDHPQLVAAEKRGGIDDLTFRQLTYEIAFSEYALALASELAKRDEYYDFTDPIYDVRETMNRVARRGSHLYESE